ncbi:MAG: hypothetical protein C4534_11385 [Gaiellales bacterium]|nr:MAG: hypothetical protein C4534_11385 [Gaiellales bacterium]
MIKGADGADLLVVDRRMPYLERRCQDLADRLPHVSVIIDRRIAQDMLNMPDRRSPGLGASEFGGSPAEAD